MTEPQYWLGISAPQTWTQAKEKHNVDQPHPFGFPKGRSKTVRAMRRGDRIVNYGLGDHAFRAVWEITRGHHILDGAFPECVEVRPIVINEDGVEFDEVQNKLNCFRKLASKKRWSGLVRQSARGWDYHDGQIILNALLRGDGENYPQESAVSWATIGIFF